MCYKNDIERRFDISNYEVDSPSSISKNEKIWGMLKDELGGVIGKEFIGLRPKMYSYLTDHDKVGKCQKVL